MTSFLGPHLHVRGSSTPVSTTTALRGAPPLLAVYVSASWCPPCKKFTPELNKWFTGGGSAKAAVVFASLDRDEESFTSYFTKMAFSAALPFGSGEAFASRFGVAGIPALLVFTRCGELVTTKGVEGLLREQQGGGGGGPPFPWVWGGERIGQRVALAGLEKAPHLNGEAGTVVGASEASGRFRVRLAGSGEAVAVRAEALVHAPAWGADLVGARVAVKGLEKAAHLNGLEGRVVGADEASGRFQVALAGREEVAAVKRGNLEVLP